MVILLIALMFRGELHDAFLFDDYHVLRNSSIGTIHSVIAEFGHVPWHGVFYRPVASLVYWLTFQWAARDPLLWHIWSIAIHAANSVLVFLLLRLLKLSRNAALAGSVFFALYAGTAEAVVWLSAGYDLTCTFLMLLTLITMLAYSKRPHWVTLTSALLLCALACGTKESAFSIPLLGAASAIPFVSETRRNLLKASLYAAILCAALFIYRWWAINGIGGYTSNQSPTFLKFSFIHTVNGLLFRAWGVLFFPINWSEGLSKPEAVTFAIYIGILLLVIAVVRARRDLLLCAIAFTFASLLPIYQMILISADLAGARVLYAPTVGLAILVGALFSTKPLMRTLPAFIALLLFHATLLQHNLKFWREASAIAPATCKDMAAIVAEDRSHILVTGLPSKRKGVPFLANGFPECVTFYTPGEQDRFPDIDVGDAANSPAKVFIWDDATGRLRPR